MVVSDTGAGVSPEFLAHLFTAFRQESEGHARSHEGDGVGLSVTERLVGLMGGEIAVESTPGVGTTFTVTLPAAVDAGEPDLGGRSTREHRTSARLA